MNVLNIIKSFTITDKNPNCNAFSAICSEAAWAAYVVDLREFLNPKVPAEAHDFVLPFKSVSVIIVLLGCQKECFKDCYKGVLRVLCKGVMKSV